MLKISGEVDMTKNDRRYEEDVEENTARRSWGVLWQDIKIEPAQDKDEKCQKKMNARNKLKHPKKSRSTTSSSDCSEGKNKD